MSSLFTSFLLAMVLQANCSPVILCVHRCVTPNCPLPSSLPMLYVDRTSSIGRPNTVPIGAGFEGFVEAPLPPVEADGWLGLGGPAAFPRAMSPELLFSGAEPPLMVSGPSLVLPWEQQLPMVRERDRERERLRRDHKIGLSGGQRRGYWVLGFEEKGCCNGERNISIEGEGGERREEKRKKKKKKKNKVGKNRVIQLGLTMMLEKKDR
ncbi:LOW QUALITY PROTEIN: hypothetical protein TorRG33x02_064930 [Trema orientale]|uniref:Transmembrane protein n=1 Tax=Trema orientale TaxID=63057 RepID=A0A2P5FII7_TREOI|nr:LOW QUALITY PROTEIN: hypothetical protein TorRG33x02_064930 [Trema orientale]